MRRPGLATQKRPRQRTENERSDRILGQVTCFDICNAFGVESLQRIVHKSHFCDPVHINSRGQINSVTFCNGMH